MAEQLLRGGIPAVRQAIDEQNDGARADGRPAIAPTPCWPWPKQLLPVVNLASWKDRATSAQSAGQELRLRELRAVVAASRTVTLDEEGRTLAKALQESLEHRVDGAARRLGARMVAAPRHGPGGRRPAHRHPPARARRPGCRPSWPCGWPQAAGAAMTADLAPAEWLALLDAVLESPVRRTSSRPGSRPDPRRQAAARHAAGWCRELAKLLGLRIPPPPPRRTLVPRVPVSPAGGGSAAAP